MNCVQPGCTGQYDEDGYCDVDGTKAPGGLLDGTASAAPSSAPSSATGAPSLPSTPSTPSMPSAMSSMPSMPSSTTSSGPGTSRTHQTGTSRTAGGGAHRLGAGLVAIEPAEVPDPAERVHPDPMLPEERRYCAKCGEPVGRSREGRPGRIEGFCPKDGTPFSFRPKLKSGD